jgi:hypothetical protein
MNSVLFEAKARKGMSSLCQCGLEDSGTNDLIISAGTIGLTFDQIAKAIGRNEVWLAAAFYGQVAYYSGSLNP